MEDIKAIIKKLISEYPNASINFKRNFIKEYLHILILHFIYSHLQYSQLIFYGGSCLRHCFDLERLSEDLDFIDLKKEIKLKQLSVDLKKFLKHNFNLQAISKIQKFRIYLKFPILQELNLANSSDSNFLIIKVEISNKISFCKKFPTIIKPLFKFNRSILIKTFDLETLLATKLKAIFYRQWQKKDKKGTILVKVKGRDYFDLMWYLGKGIKPNLNCFSEFKNSAELKNKLLEQIKNIDQKSIQYDLENLIADKYFVMNLGKNIKEILIKNIKEKL